MKKLKWVYDELTPADGTASKYIYNLMLGNERLCQLIVEKGTSQVSYYYGDSKLGSTIGDLSTDTIDEIKAKALQYTEETNDEKLQDALLHATKCSHINNLIDLELSGVSQEMVTLDSTIEFLNGLLAYDRQAVTDLLNARVTANQAMVDHPTVQAGESSIGFLGVLNGLFGVNEVGWGKIQANLENGVVRDFTRTGERLGQYAGISLIEVDRDDWEPVPKGSLGVAFNIKTGESSHVFHPDHFESGPDKDLRLPDLKEYDLGSNFKPEGLPYDPANIKDAFENLHNDHSADGLYQ